MISKNVNTYEGKIEDDGLIIELPEAIRAVAKVVVLKPLEGYEDSRFTDHIADFYVRSKVPPFKMIKSFDHDAPLVLKVKYQKKGSYLHYIDAKTDELIPFANDYPTKVKSYKTEIGDQDNLWHVVEILKWGDPNVGWV